MSDADRRSAGDALAREVMAAFAGDPRSPRPAVLEAHVSAGGPVFVLKRQPHALRDVHAVLDVGQQSGVLSGTEPRPWEYRFDADRLVADVRRLSSWPRPWPWVPEQAGAFAAAALWTYLLLPYRLLDPEIGRRRLADRGGLRRLRLTFPDTIATHSRVQTLHVDHLGIVRRHDDTAGIMGRWARPAHLVTAVDGIDGHPVGTRRTVVPKAFGRPLPRPTLVHVDIDRLEFRVTASR